MSPPSTPLGVSQPPARATGDADASDSATNEPHEQLESSSLAASSSTVDSVGGPSGPYAVLPPIRSHNHFPSPSNFRGIGSRLNSLNIISDYYFRHRPSPAQGPESAFHPRRWYPAPETDLSVNVLPSPLRNVGVLPSTSRQSEEGQISSETDSRHSDADMNQSDEDGIDISYAESETQRAIQFIDSIDVADDSSESETDSRSESSSDTNARERLLLSSARQNTSGTNRLITRLISFNNSDSHNPSDTGPALPLRRQNAIRSRSRNSNKRVFYRNGADPSNEESKKELELTMERIKKDSTNLIQDIDHFLTIIRASKSSHNLFHSGAEKLDLIYAFKMTGLEHNFHLEGKMDSFLRVRQSQALWTRHILKNDSVLASNSSKRKYESQSPFNGNKRRKVYDAPTSHDFSDVADKFTKPSLMLSPKERYRIISVQYSSLFRSGSCFGINICTENNSFSDMVLTNVDYNNKSFNGVFRIEEKNDTSQTDYWKRIFKYAKFFCGENGHPHEKMTGNSALMRRLFLLERAEYDLIHSLSKGQNFKRNKLSHFNIPFRGNIIDFKSHDLRFLPSHSKKSTTNDSYAFTKHSSQTFKYNLANLQLIEWMRLQPFQEYKDCYLEMYAKELKDSLEKISSEGPKYGSQQTIDLAKEFKSTVHLLTQSYTLNDCCSATASNVDPKHNSDRYYHQNWEKRLSKELLNNLTSQRYESLLNIQLNYVLFTLKVNLIELLDGVLNTILETVKRRSTENESKEFRYLMEITQLFDVDQGSNEDISAILVCSMNRKTGSLHIHNTLPYINYKNQSSRRVIGVVDSGVSRYTSTASSSGPFNAAPFNSWLENDDMRERYMRDDRPRFDQERPRVIDPYIDGRNIDMFGFSKQAGTLGGGSPSFDIM